MASRNDYLKIRSKGHNDFLLAGFGAGVDNTLSEYVLPINVATECYNFDFSDGTLKEGYGLDSSFLAAENVTAVWGFSKYNYDKERQEEIIMYSTLDGEVYYFPPCPETDKQPPGGNAVKLEGVNLSGVPKAINYRLYSEDVILLCSDKDAMIVWDGINPAYSVVSAPMITSLAMHFERLFVTTSGERNSVWFSEDLDPTNWTLELDEGGFIELMDERGKLNKVISYLNYIYIFRDYGISRLTAYADQTDFSVSNLFVSSGKIYAETVCLCGDRVLFLADDGLYAFDGLSTTKILRKLGELIEGGDYANASYSGGKYYLAAKTKKGDEVVGCEVAPHENNALLVYDIANGNYQISRGFDVRKICTVFDEPHAILNDGRVAKIVKNGCIFGSPLRKKWTIPKTDFGSPDKQKHIKNLYIFTKNNIELTLKTDELSKTVRIKGRRTPQRIPIEIRGARIGAEIVSSVETAEVARVMLRVSR